MVLKLLVKDPNMRLSAEDILDDPWFRDDPATCEEARNTLYSDRAQDDSGRGTSIRTISSHISCLSVGDESEVVVGDGERSGQSVSASTTEGDESEVVVGNGESSRQSASTSTAEECLALWATEYLKSTS